MENLQSFVGGLPGGSTLFNRPETTHRAVHFDSQTPLGYVWPDLSFESAEVAPVLLVAAPAAMGKSYSSRAIAGHTSSILVDLAKLRVGENSLVGALQRSLTPVAAGELIESIRAGKSTLVLDAVDEAILRSGVENFLSFLEDLQHICRGAVPTSQVVMLGREDSIGLTALALDDLGVAHRTARIEPLDREQARLLIDSVLDTKNENGVAFETHRKHRAPFEALRDALFSKIAIALEPECDLEVDWEPTRHFLGYPPVLLALSERLAVSNMQDELNSLEGTVAPAASQSRQGELLARIVERILDREQQKVAHSIGEEFGIDPSDGSARNLYSRNEQIARVLQSMQLGAPSATGPESLLDHERPRYEKQITTFVMDHPFRRGETFASIVFSDYALAAQVTSPLLGAQTIPRASEHFRVGPFYLHFVAALGGASRSEELGASVEVPLDRFDALVQSARQASPRTHWSLTHFHPLPPTLTIHLDPTTGDDPLLFVAESQEAIHEFSSPITRCVITTDQDLVLRATGQELILGPSAIVSCRSIEFSAQQIVVPRRRRLGAESSPTPEGFGTLILAKEPATSDPRLELISHEADGLRVYWPSPVYPWHGYAFDLPQVDLPVATQDWLDIQVATRRILLYVHSLSNGEIGASLEKLRRYSLAPNGLGEAVLQGLLELRVMKIKGKYVLLDTNELSVRGINWSLLRGDFSPADFEQLTTDLLATEPVRAHFN